MRRYRTVILVLVIGVLPMVVLLVLAVTVIIPALEQPEAPVELVQPVEAPPPPEPVMVWVALVAARPLPVGTLLTASDLAVREVDSGDLPRSRHEYVYASEVAAPEAAEPGRHALRGFAVRQALAAGEPLTLAAVVGPDDARFLATVLAADRVAVSIPVSLATRQAKVVSPGNRVDVLLAVEQQGGRVVRTIVEDVRVIAVNSRVIAEEGGRPNDSQSAARAGTGRTGPTASDDRPEVLTVTLEVLPVQGEHLALGAYEGQLSLAIRPLAPGGGGPDRDSVPADPDAPLASTLRPPPRPVAIRVMRGIDTELVVFKSEPGGYAPVAGAAAGRPPVDAIADPAHFDGLP